MRKSQKRFCSKSLRMDYPPPTWEVPGIWDTEQWPGFSAHGGRASDDEVVDCTFSISLNPAVSKETGLGVCSRSRLMLIPLDTALLCFERIKMWLHLTIKIAKSHHFPIACETLLAPFVRWVTMMPWSIVSGVTSQSTHQGSTSISCDPQAYSFRHSRESEPWWCTAIGGSWGMTPKA